MKDIKFVNYSSGDMDVLRELYLIMYESKLKQQKSPLEIINNSKIIGTESSDTQVTLIAENIYDQNITKRQFDLVISATGFRDLGSKPHQEPIPPLIEPLSNLYRFNDLGFCHVNLNYSLEPLNIDTPPVFLNGICESTHGMGDGGTFSLLALRSKDLSIAIESKRKLWKEYNAA